MTFVLRGRSRFVVGLALNTYDDDDDDDDDDDAFTGSERHFLTYNCQWRVYCKYQWLGVRLGVGASL